MIPGCVSAAEIARAAGLTERHVRSRIARAEGCGLCASRLWHGKLLDVRRAPDGGVLVAFASLPDHIREAFVMLDQYELPFSTPPSGAPIGQD